MIAKFIFLLFNNFVLIFKCSKPKTIMILLTLLFINENKI
ncbi:uncharacterized protein METZ01_LOCUS184995 [marine metagenome]|uniref:Uncharacterized protein n=1 Tax=marine metagenome TaxID=408172 RepID=A0A382D350_9ZZZZ